MRITNVGSIEIDSFNNLSAGYSLRTGYLPSAFGGSGIMAKDHSGSSRDGCAVYGHDGISFHTNGPTERMRIDSAGRLLLGVSSIYNNNYQMQVAIPSTGGIVFRMGGSAVRYPLAFQNPNGNFVGSVFTTTSSTSYGTSSDYRLKENVVDIADGITRVKQLAPKRFNFIVDTDTIVDGFLAHEAQTVVPEAVTGEKDGEEMQCIDQSKLVPLLTAALQEAIAKIETLETKVAALEATS